MTRMLPGPGWRRTELSLTMDLAHGGRWTSLASPHREWLWRNSDERVVTQRALVRPGTAFVDAGGAEECFPTIRGLPDHGDAWSRPWTGSDAHANVQLDPFTLKRDVEVNHDVSIDYRITATTPTRFIHAVHILLDLSPEARIVAPGVTHARVLDHPVRGEITDVTWPNGLGEALDRLGPDDGTAIGACLLDCQQATVFDKNDALTLAWRTRAADQRLLSMFLWRNLCGWPTGGPYRSIGIEPMVGRAASLEVAPTKDVAEAGANQDFLWSLHIASWRRCNASPPQVWWRP
jgi:hypothetical protein